jgi:hypothetical protein
LESAPLILSLSKDEEIASRPTGDQTAALDARSSSFTSGCARVVAWM